MDDDPNRTPPHAAPPRPPPAEDDEAARPAAPAAPPPDPVGWPEEPPPRLFGLGAGDGLALGWRLTVDHFKILWVIGLLAYVAQGYLGILGATPYLGAVISIAVTIFVQPPLTAGLAYAIRRKAEGRGVRVEDLFEGFRQRYWESVVTALPPIAVGAVFGALIVGALVAEAIALGIFAGSITWDARTIALTAAIAVGTLAPLLLATLCAMMFFAFSPVAVWDHPGSGWAAVKASARLVRRRFASMLLLELAFACIFVAATVAGVLTCCAGLVFTIPLAMVWQMSALVVLHRGWTADAADDADGLAP